MQILTNPKELAAQCKAWHKAGDDIALVPTMGYYHHGHEDLMAYARTQAKRLVVSLFVNPTQFGPGEDLEAYPRDPQRDADIARNHGADALFMPQPEAMYAQDHSTWVEVPELSRGLCGLTRPVHFRGVCTVVLKLFMLTGADVAVFGQKDWQQQAILRRMVRDLDVPVRIETRETVREADGLALSSRNGYLTDAERAEAPQLRRTLEGIRSAVQQGERDYASLCERACAELDARGWKTDYIRITNRMDLQAATVDDRALVVLAASQLGRARLIDNLEIDA